MTSARVSAHSLDHGAARDALPGRAPGGATPREHTEHDEPAEAHPVPREHSGESRADAAGGVSGTRFAFPASYAQERLWFDDQIEPGSALYNSAVAFRLRGDLDVEALRASLIAVARRHDALRTTFAFRDGRLVQIVAEELVPQIDIRDLRGEPAAVREARAAELAQAAAREPFDLTAGPLVRALLLRLGDVEHRLVFTLHHIVADGWSVRVIFEELSAFYAARVRGVEPHLEPVAVQYPDFAVWEREWLHREVLDRELAFWRRQLGGPLAELALPTDRPASRSAGFRGAARYVSWPRRLTDRLHELARSEGASLFMVLLAALDVLLHRYAGDEEIRVGAPVANRDHPGLERAVGFFANTVVFRSDLSGDPPFRTLLRRVRAMALEVYQNHHAPFQKVVEVVRPARDARRNVLFPVLLALQPALEGTLHLPGIQVEVLPLDTGASKFDLQLELQETPSGLRGTVQYATELFDDGTVARMIGHLHTLLKGILDAPDLPISALPMITPAEREQVVATWNDTRTSYPRDACVHELFARQAARASEAIAVVYGDRTLTYGELDHRSAVLAARLLGLGVGPGVLVGVAAERSPEYLVAILGVLRAGGAYVPLDLTYPRERLAFMLADSRARVLLAADEGAVAGLDLEATVMSLAQAMQAPPGERPELPRAPVTAERAAYVMYTSGSTGRPKGVVVPHRAVCALALDRSAGAIGAGDVVAHASSLSFDPSTFEIWGALLNGARLAILPTATLLDPARLAAELSRHGVTVMALPHSLFRHIVRDRPAAFRGLRYLQVGGEPLDGESVRRVLAAGPPSQLANAYGPTEATTFATTYVVRQAPSESSRIQIGRPIDNARVYVLDRHRRPVGIGVPGELYIGGDGVALGYLHRPELTAERFLPDPFSPYPGARMYRTGDRARLLPSGDLDFLGRVDRQMKVRGFRIEPEEVEAVLRGLTGVSDAAVVAREDEPGDRRLIAYVIASDPSSPPEPAGLRREAALRLPEHMVPAAIVPVDTFPLLPNGKIDYAALPRPEQHAGGGGGAADRPRDALEMQLATLWERVLHTRPIGIHDNFFELGGHSLLAATLLSEVAAAFEHHLPLVTLFRAPTVASLARVLREEGWASPAPTLVPLQPDGPRAPFVLVHRAGGHLLVYRSLVLAMPAEQPVWGIQAPGHERMQPVYTSVPAMAAHYVEELVRRWPEGPYHLGGSSFGGIVAFEMARLLRERGAAMGRLVLFDTYPPDQVQRLAHPPLWYRLSRFGRRMARRAEELSTRSNAERAAALLRRARMLVKWLGAKRSAVTPGPGGRPSAPGTPRHDPVVAAFYRAAAEHRMQPYPGRVTLFVAANTVRPPFIPADLGWSRWALGGVDVHHVPGTHLSMLEEPHVRVLADALCASLRD